MSLETFSNILSKFPKVTNQIAFGIGGVTDIDRNPDLWKIMEYCRENGVIPNITVNGAGVKNEVAKKLSNICGAIAVSQISEVSNKKYKLRKINNRDCSSEDK
jgi:MoaA/NifB/PqqE/SkfB family radical SAM enzyme